jgi:lipid A 3-O-deacylase
MIALARCATLGCGVLLLLASAGRAAAQTISVSVDNDYLNFWLPPHERPDHEYTSGVHIAWEHEARPAGVLRRLMPGGCAGRRDCRHATRFGVGHEMYTPRREDAAGPLPGERPHAGYLFGIVEGRVATPGRSRSGWVEVGLVGPATRTADVQSVVHRWFDFREPIGWDQQLGNEPVVQFGGEVQRAFSAAAPAGVALSAVPQLRGELGNRRVAAAPGVMLGRSRGMSTAPAHHSEVAPVGVAVFAAVQPTLVLRNLFLDGSTFRDSHSVEKRHGVLHASGGVTVQVLRASIAWTVFARTREYVTEPDGHVFSRLSLSVATGRRPPHRVQ